MNDRQDWSSVGMRLRESIQDGFATGDFRYFNDVLSDTVKMAMGGNGQQSGGSGYADEKSSWNETARPESEDDTDEASDVFHKVGHLSSMLYIGGGGFGAVLFGVLLFLFFISGLWSGYLSVGAILVTGLFTLICLALLDHGMALRGRLQRAGHYLELCGNRNYIDIEDLSSDTGRSRKWVLKDVRNMIDVGIYPHGHLDEQQTCLMLDDTMYKQYLQLEEQRKALQAEEDAAAMKEGLEHDRTGGFAADKSEKSGEDNPELAKMMNEGKDYIRRVREQNDIIQGEVISAKLFELENLLKQIFERLGDHPEQMGQMKKFMNYYLPTTLKLVEAYAEFDRIDNPDQDIISAKEEIEKTIDTINEAFKELLNKMYRAAAFDVSADAQVLQNMLAREGLTGGKDFSGSGASHDNDRRKS